MFTRALGSFSLVAFVLTGVIAGCGSDDGSAPPPPAAPPAPAAEAAPGNTLPTTDPPPPPAPSFCADATGTYEAKSEPGNVLFLLDRSGSMHIDLGTGDTRWSATEKGLFNLLGVLPATTQAGIMMFPQGDAPVNAYCGIDPTLNDVKCKSGWPEPSEVARCAESTYKVGVPSAPLTASQVQAIQDHVTASDAGFYWGTPLKTALQAAIDAQRTSTLQGSKSIILLTDGNPTSCTTQGISNDIKNVINVATTGVTNTSAQNPLVRTFVIGVIDNARQAAKAENLSPLAVAGGTARKPGCEANNECFYAVTATNFAADLKKVFDEISVQAFDCTFNLPPQSSNTDPSKINVTVDGSAVSRDMSHQNGWDYLPNGTEIQLYGQACTDMKTKKSKLEVVLGCKTIVSAQITN